MLTHTARLSGDKDLWYFLRNRLLRDIEVFRVLHRRGVSALVVFLLIKKYVSSFASLKEGGLGEELRRRAIARTSEGAPATLDIYGFRPTGPAKETIYIRVRRDPVISRCPALRVLQCDQMERPARQVSTE